MESEPVLTLTVKTKLIFFKHFEIQIHGILRIQRTQMPLVVRFQICWNKQGLLQ